MTLSPVDALVRARIGLDPLSLGAATFQRAVAARMTARAVATDEAYAALLTADRDEWATLVDELVVPESWFFRGGAAYFRQLARWLRERSGGRAQRVLSVPCGCGEEPYSLVLALDDEGVPPGVVRVEGVDLCPASVRRAEEGRYPAFAFREADADPRPRHFRDAGPGRWELEPRVRDAVRFHVGNLVAPEFLAAEPPFDLILCRNLFIYLTDEARGRAVANLRRLLTPGGRLCLTPAEADRLPPELFTADGPASLAVFTRADEPPPGGPRSGVYPRPAPKSGVFPRPAVSPPVSTPLPSVPGTRFDAVPPPTTATARELADAGKLDAARAVCEMAVRAGPSAEWYSLLGVIDLAAGRAADAEASFRRALYLNPDHREALTHLAMLCDRRGDAGPASGLRRRLSRLPEATA
ncbi:MAG TPA: CheR family methyltransferase [Urbifossiella sp.]|nr:CheR family methyltransferase [Urbifossiella sp.]